MSSCSQDEECIKNFRTGLLLFADDVILLASLVWDTQHALGQFAPKCKVPKMRVSTSKSKAMFLCCKRVKRRLSIFYKNTQFLKVSKVDPEIARGIIYLIWPGNTFKLPGGARDHCLGNLTRQVESFTYQHDMILLSIWEAVHKQRLEGKVI